MQYQAVIFDLDGTLLDTLEDIADAANSVLSRFDFPQHDLQTYKYFVGEGIGRLIQQALPQKKFEEDFITLCVTLMREEYSKRWANKTRLYPEVPDILDSLTNQGIKMAILSNKPDDFTKEMAAKFLIKWEFSVVQGEKPLVAKKPDPSAALDIAKKLKLPPRRFIFLGDSEVDMKIALAAGMHPVGVLWGFRTAEELIASGAKVLIKNSADLITVITH
ncbi:MAG: HAD family hydrolase [Thermodesulfobacteriota bacterium]|jgi:phosphoglycolate phosphatase|nr:MAG: HAD family hydrolase [Thermodesulfobacteriota bacterium]